MIVTDASTTPESTEQLAEQVRAAVAQQRQIVVSGTDGDGIRLTKMADVIDYPARDMTITVGAGMTVARLAEILAGEDQQLPVDVADASVSIGQAVLCDASGPRQLSHGTLRDYLLGFEAVDGQGRVFHAGGRVVKNVAGYDLCRLMVGSGGSLGILTQVTLKLVPRPACELVQQISVAPDQLAPLLDLLNTSAAAPLLADVVTGRQAATTMILRIGFAGLPSACQWQWDQWQQECRELLPEIGRSQTVPLVDHLAEWAGFEGVQIRCLPSTVAPLSLACAQADLAVFAHANGVCGVATDDRERVADICGQVTEPGHAVVLPASGIKSQTPLSKRVQSTFDPHGVFV